MACILVKKLSKYMDTVQNWKIFYLHKSNKFTMIDTFYYINIYYINKVSALLEYAMSLSLFNRSIIQISL